MNLKKEIKIIRKAIRKHRDQKGDDRCWVDDYWLYDLMPGNKGKVLKKPSYNEAMKKCIDYYENRSNKKEYVKKEVCVEVKDYDSDLDLMKEAELRVELNRLKKAIIKHRKIKNKTLIDDKELYFILPEKISADFSLPKKEEFIGGIKEGSGCPNFWKSHEKCDVKLHELHKWGPCR